MTALIVGIYFQTKRDGQNTYPKIKVVQNSITSHCPMKYAVAGSTEQGKLSFLLKNIKAGKTAMTSWNHVITTALMLQPLNYCYLYVQTHVCMHMLTRMCLLISTNNTLALAAHFDFSSFSSRPFF